MDALQQALGEALSIEITEFDAGQSCDLSIRPITAPDIEVGRLIDIEITEFDPNDYGESADPIVQATDTAFLMHIRDHLEKKP
jgi:hypothetical protein